MTAAGAGFDGEELASLATRLANDAGRLLTEGLGRDRRAVSHKSSPTDMVSEMDRASERVVVDGLRIARPDDAILAEEGGLVAGTSGLTWVVDPLDGTTNYLYGLGPFAVSIAACLPERTLVGVVHDPLHGETFRAVAGKGAWLGDRRLRCGPAPPLGSALVGTGFSYLPRRRGAQARVLSHLLPAVRDIRRAGAAAVDLCWVAAGRLDAFYEAGLQPWDVAAGRLVAEEAGAWCGLLEGPPGSVPTMVAARRDLATSLLDLLRASGADRVPEG
ncbi:MAG: inositol monophosphatase family protein [Acidimicrobiales bacterium]